MRRGVETLVLSLSNELARQGIDVSILTPRQTQPPLVQLLPQVHLRQFPTFRYFESYTIVPFYVETLLREKYDWVVVFFADFGEGLALRLASPLVQPKMMLYLTFPYESAPHRYRAYLKWQWDRQATQILADAAYTAREAEALFRRKILTLPSATDPQRFQPNSVTRAMMRRQLGLSEDAVVLLNVAALERRKGIWRVLQILPQVVASCPQVRYLILGDGPQEKELRQQVVDLKLEAIVQWIGSVSELPKYYCAADIFVMLPDEEAGSIACLEAMASGLAVLVSASGGFDEVVSNDRGWRVDINNPEEIIAKLIALSDDVNLRRRLGHTARQAVIEEYSWESIASRMIPLFR